MFCWVCRWVPRDALSMLQNLKFLDLNRNPISRVGPGDFHNLLHLEELRCVFWVKGFVVDVLRFGGGCVTS